MGEQGKLFTDKYIVNGHGCYNDVMTMDELDIIMFSGAEYSVKKQEKIEDEDKIVDGE